MSTYYVQGMILGPQDRAHQKKKKTFVSKELTFVVKDINKTSSKICIVSAKF